MYVLRTGGIYPMVLKELVGASVRPLFSLKVYIKCLMLRKKKKIMSIFRNGKKQNVVNYRPVVLLKV